MRGDADDLQSTHFHGGLGGSSVKKGNAGSRGHMTQVTAAFKADFDLVMEAFKVKPGEIEEAKAVCRLDMDAAIESITETAMLIRWGWKPCR